jgi:hypothetical protein
MFYFSDMSLFNWRNIRVKPLSVCSIKRAHFSTETKNNQEIMYRRAEIFTREKNLKVSANFFEIFGKIENKS